MQMDPGNRVFPSLHWYRTKKERISRYPTNKTFRKLLQRSAELITRLITDLTTELPTGRTGRLGGSYWLQSRKLGGGAVANHPIDPNPLSWQGVVVVVGGADSINVA